jgi:hypothetical protein
MNAAKAPITYPESEDPSVFRDPRGNYHLLTCVYAGVCAGGERAVRSGPLQPPAPPPPFAATSTRTTRGASRAWSAAATHGAGTGSAFPTSQLARLAP